MAAVFGEEPAPAAPRGARPAAGEGASAEAPKAGGGFSFDEFFGGAQEADGTPTTRSAAARRDEDEDDFKRWLKGLKS